MKLFDADGSPMTPEAYLAKYGRPAAKPAAKKTTAARSLEQRIAALEAGDDDDCPPCDCHGDDVDDEPEESARRPVGRPESAERRLGAMARQAAAQVRAAGDDGTAQHRAMALRAAQSLGLKLTAADFAPKAKATRTPKGERVEAIDPSRPFQVIAGKIRYV